MDIQFVEADVEIGFNLVDMAERELSQGDAPLACRVLQDAEEVFRDIECRLGRAGARERESFRPLVGELRRQIDLVRVGLS